MTEDLTTLETIDNAINALESAVDESATNEDNIDNGADTKSEETPTVEQLQTIVNEQGARIEQLINQMGKMVTLYGARLSNQTGKVESMKSLKVEETFEDDPSGTEDIPLLNDIKLS